MSPEKPKYVGAVDQGTTSTRFVIFNHKGEIISKNQREHRQIYPKPDWVEHDPIEIRDNTYKVIKSAMDQAAIKPEELAAIGITNQRETTVVWDRETGTPYYNAIVWQDTRTSEICKKLSVNGDIRCYQKKTGLPLATYFSGPKIKWILDHVDGVRAAANKGRAAFGTMDSWIIWWLTGGPDGGIHMTDVSNAGRTLLMNIQSLKWDPEMLSVMDIPESMLPEIKSSSEVYGYTAENGILNRKVPISGDLGDQQAALFGQTCFSPGEAKNTYGTGCFLLLNTGENIVYSNYGLLTTPAYRIGTYPAVYALEGSVAIAGSLVQWLRDSIGLIKDSSEIEALARTVSDNGGIYFVPAFSGLFAPYWRSDARGLIIGLTHFINKGHIARAVLEACAFQAKEIFHAMEKDSRVESTALKVDGGMVANELLMQFQSDILGVPIIRPKIIETTVLGAAYAAGLAVSFWKEQETLRENWGVDKEWHPRMAQAKRDELYKGWRKAVERTFAWIE